MDTGFGLPDDGINGIMEALRVRQDKVRFIQVRHEESAAFMACGYAKFTGRRGVCLATSGPGGIHLLNGLHGFMKPASCESDFWDILLRPNAWGRLLATPQLAAVLRNSLRCMEKTPNESRN